MIRGDANDGQTVTFFWAISDFLSAKSDTISFTEDMIQGADDNALLHFAADSSHKGSGAALWMLLLLRLTAVATDQRLELRNSKPLSEMPLCRSLTQLRRNPDLDAHNIRIWRQS